MLLLRAVAGEPSGHLATAALGKLYKFRVLPSWSFGSLICGFGGVLGVHDFGWEVHGFGQLGRSMRLHGV